MIEHTSHAGLFCGVTRSLDTIDDGWSLSIVRDAFDGLRRFSESQHSPGLLKNVLTVHLRDLVAHNILEAMPTSDGSAYQDYVLAEKGCALSPLLVALRQRGEAFCFVPDEAHVIFADKATGKPVPCLELRAQDGRVLVPEDTVVVRPSAIRPTKRQRVKAS